MDDDNTNNNQPAVDNTGNSNPVNDMQQGQQLPQDNGTPASPPSDVPVGDDTHPSTDSASDMDATEVNDAGTQAATGVDLPGSGGVNEEDDVNGQNTSGAA